MCILSMLIQGEQKTKLFIGFLINSNPTKETNKRKSVAEDASTMPGCNFTHFFPRQLPLIYADGGYRKENWNNMTVRFKQISVTHHGKGSMGLLSIDTTELRSGGMPNLVVQVVADST